MMFMYFNKQEFGVINTCLTSAVSFFSCREGSLNAPTVDVEDVLANPYLYFWTYDFSVRTLKQHYLFGVAFV